MLVHVELQAQGEQDFAQRMYGYNTRIWQRCGRPAVSLALLLDEDPHFCPDEFVREKGGCRTDVHVSGGKIGISWTMGRRR